MKLYVPMHVYGLNPGPPGHNVNILGKRPRNYATIHISNT